MRAEQRRTLPLDSEHVLLLKGLLLWAVVGVAFLGTWHYGLLQQVWHDDATGLASAITLVFLVAAARGSWQVFRLSRTLNHADAVERFVRGSAVERLLWHDHPDLPEGCVSAYIRDLHTKASNGARGVAIDQGLLLDGFEIELKSGHEFGWFVADLLLSLGLLGTVIGFILMLAPISAIDTTDHGAIQAALAAMTGGMAVALYTTLTGLIGGMLLKVQGFLLDGAVQELVRRTTQLTEIHVLPAIERMRCDAQAA